MADRRRFVAARVPGFGLSYSEASYYGWKHSIQIGWWVVFFGPICAASDDGGSDEIDF